MSELRDLYAGLAMHAMITSGYESNKYVIASESFNIADIMMEEHEKRRTQEADAADGSMGG
jgi:hypothetical protein